MREFIVNYAYLLGYCIAWTGLIRQIIYIYRSKDAKSLTLFYGWCLILAKVGALPRALSGGHWVWWLQEGFSTLLTFLYFLGIVLYRRKISEK